MQQRLLISLESLQKPDTSGVAVTVQVSRSPTFQALSGASAPGPEPRIVPKYLTRSWKCLGSRRLRRGERLRVARQLGYVCLAVVIACVTPQDHGPRDETSVVVDAGGVVSDATPPTDAATNRNDSAVPPEHDASMPALPDAGTSELPDSAVIVDAAPTAHPAAAMLNMQATLARRADTERRGGALVGVPKIGLLLEVAARNEAATFEAEPPTRTNQYCDFWPPLQTGTWPPGTSTPGVNVPLDATDVVFRVDGRLVPASVVGDRVVYRTDVALTAAPEIEMTVHLAQGTIRRSVAIPQLEALTAPTTAPAASQAFIARYQSGQDLRFTWQNALADTATQHFSLTGSDANLWARCNVPYDANELVIPWEEAHEAFLDGPGEDANTLNAVVHGWDDETTTEHGVEVTVGHAHTQTLSLLPPEL